MKIEDKAYFLFDTPGMSQKEKDKRAKYWLALEKQQAKKAMEDWRFAVAQEERYMGSVFVTPSKQREMEARTQAAYLKAKKLNPDYQGFSMPVEDKRYFAANKNSEALKQALTDTNYNISDVVNYNEENVGTLAGSGNFTVKIGMGHYEHWFYKITPSGKYKKNSVRKLDFARQGSKARFAKEYILWALPKGETDRLHERPIAEGLYTPAQVDDVKRKATAAGWHSFRVAAMMGFDDMTNAFKGKGIKKRSSRTGTKTKFANRGAFAEASSSPVLGSLLEKKVMPEGGWRAVETDGAALVIAFEDNDIAGNFARRAAENGYSATAPMAMAGRFWNVKVQNENNK